MRPVTGTGLVVGALVATLVALLFPVMAFDSSNAAANSDAVSTQYGPLTAAERDFVVKVRLAGLWELPAGRMAQEKGTTQAVKRVGQHLIEGHTELDKKARDVARDLGVELPNQPTVQQQGWVGQMGAAQGAEFDTVMTDLLRKAHGKIFNTIAKIRQTTRNTRIRELATLSNSIVLDHITVLEDTGLVDFEGIASDAATSLPTPPGSENPPGVPADQASPVVGTASPVPSLPPAVSAPPGNGG